MKSFVLISVSHFVYLLYQSLFNNRLKLPGKILDEGSSGKYEVEGGDYIVTILKEVEGFYFEGLDMITSLLKPKENQYNAPKIEVLSGKSYSFLNSYM